MRPSADHVATAIVAACRETGGDAIMVAKGETVRGSSRAGPQGVALPRARAYAFHALRIVFDSSPPSDLARCVGASNPHIYFSVVNSYLTKPLIPWWDDAAFMRVLAAVELVPLPKALPLKAAPILPKRRGPVVLGALADVDGHGDRPAGRPRAEEITDERSRS